MSNTITNERGAQEAPESPQRAEYLTALATARSLEDDAQGIEIVMFQCADPACSSFLYTGPAFVAHRDRNVHDGLDRVAIGEGVAQW